MNDSVERTAVALAFQGVLNRLEDPKGVTDSILEWAEYLGVASERDQHVVNGFCAKREIHIDFFPGPNGGKLSTLERAKNEMGIDADEHIYFGSSKRDEVIAEKAGWSYVDIEEAAERSGWDLE